MSVMVIQDTFGLRRQNSNVCISSVTVILFITLSKIAQTAGDDPLVQAFAERFQRLSGEEFFEVWHTDCHRRCRVQLIEHINLACNFDPYRIVSKRSIHNNTEHKEKTHQMGPFLTRHASAAFLAQGHKVVKNGHRIHKRGVMEECCYTKSCSWEEYAEFCHNHNRQESVRNTLCYR